MDEIKTDVSKIEIIADSLVARVEVLRRTIAELEQHLKPVLLPPTLTPEKNDAMPEGMDISPLGGVLLNADNSLTLILRHIDVIIARLEV